MKLKRDRLWYLFILAFLAGGIIDSGIAEGTLGWRFTISIPLSLFLLLGFISLARLKNKIVIILFSMLSALSCMFLTFMSYEFQHGEPSCMWGMVYAISFIPALLIGLFLGLYLSFSKEMIWDSKRLLDAGSILQIEPEQNSGREKTVRRRNNRY